MFLCLCGYIKEKTLPACRAFISIIPIRQRLAQNKAINYSGNLTVIRIFSGYL
jgi:hypothetical protein